MDAFIIDINYTNNAWGYQNNGTLILSTGAVAKYKITDSSYDNINYKLNHDHVIGKIPFEKVGQLYNLLLKTRNSVSVDEKHTAFDSGSTTYTGYLVHPYDTEKINLFTTGDYTTYNTNSAVTELVNQINQIIGK